MPKLLYPAPDTELTVTRSVVDSVIRDLIEVTHLSPDVKINYPGTMEQMKQPGSSLGSTRDPEFGSSEKIFIEVSEQFVEAEAGTSPLYEPGNQFIFDDRDLGVFMRPDYTFSELRLTVKYRANSKIEASRWRDDIRNRAMMGRNAFVHDVNYSYRFPEIFYYILTEIHRLRENNHGFHETFDQWFTKYGHPRLTLASNQTGQYTEYLMTERMGRVQGWFDFTMEAEFGQYSDNTRSWEISFDYVVNYDRLTNITIGYPIVIHNQLLSSKFRENTTINLYHNQYENLSMKEVGLRYFEATDISYKVWANNGISVPAYDDFYPNQGMVPRYTNRILTALVKIPEPREELNTAHMQIEEVQLLDIPKTFGKDSKYISFKPEILDYILSESKWITTLYESFLHLALYRGRNIATNKKSKAIRMNNKGLVFSNIQLNLREMHHIRLGLVTNPLMVNNKAMNRLRDNPCATVAIISAIYPGMDFSWIGDCTKMGRIDNSDWARIIQLLSPAPGTNPYDAHPKTGHWGSDDWKGKYGLPANLRGQVWFDTVSTFFVMPERLKG